MGDLNLGIDIAKLKKSAGGGGGGGGLTIDKLWNGTTSNTDTSIKDALLHPISDYAVIMVCTSASASMDGGTLIPVRPVEENALVYHFANLSKEVFVTVSSGDTKIRNSGSGSLATVNLYGIK